MRDPHDCEAVGSNGLTGHIQSRPGAVLAFAALPRIVAVQLTPTGARSVGIAQDGFADACRWRSA